MSIATPSHRTVRSVCPAWSVISPSKHKTVRICCRVCLFSHIPTHESVGIVCCLVGQNCRHYLLRLFGQSSINTQNCLCCVSCLIGIPLSTHETVRIVCRACLVSYPSTHTIVCSVCCLVGYFPHPNTKLSALFVLFGRSVIHQHMKLSALPVVRSVILTRTHKTGQIVSLS